MPVENINTEQQNTRRFQRSEMVQEIVSNKPGFLVKYGIVFFLITLILLVVACWFIQYPDIVNTKAKLTSINAPKVVITKIAGKLIKLFAKENEQAYTGDVLGYMESIANNEEVILLSKNIDTATILFNNNNLQSSLSFLQNDYANLGGITTRLSKVCYCLPNF
ncbi:MAG: hypothetical protein IPP48_06020 [Chitinophagaceae bacterium]|nr:hypothetical protein [Chitinophagaceae bacterium]